MKGLTCTHYQKLFIIFALFFVPFLILLNTNNAGALSVGSISASQSSYSKNFDSTIIYQTLNSQNLPAPVLTTDANLTGLWDYSLNFVFPNPVQNHSGTGFTHSIRFTLTANGDFLNKNLPNLMANSRIGFENINVNLPYCTSSLGIVSMSNNSVRFEIVNSCPYGSYASSQNFSNVLAVINYYPDSLFWCANDNASQMCPTHAVYVILSDVEYYFKVLASESDSNSQTIINQNETIINQNQQVIDQNNSDRADLQNQSSDTQADASTAAQNVNTTAASLLTIIGNFVNIIIHPPADDCRVNMNVLFAPFKSGEYGTVDLCHLDVPVAWISVMATLPLIGFMIPLCISTINTFLMLLKGATED